MIRIRFDEWALARTRLAISPLNEMVSGLYLLARQPGAAPWPYTEWARAARAVVRSEPGVAPVRLYAHLHGPAHARRVPDLFTPIDEATAEAGSSGARTLEASARAVITGRTAVVVAHRLTQARACDRIAVLDTGRIVEPGTHEELVVRGGRYAALWSAWSSR